MNIVVVGAGKVGEYLCGDLATEGNDITLIEKDKRRLERVVDQNDIMGIVGNGSSYEILLEADVNNADVFISVTPEDEVNIIACIIAKKLGAKYAIARVRNPEYSDHIDFMTDSMGIDMMFNPELEAAQDIIRSLEFPSALNVETFAKGKVNIVEILLREGSYLDGMKLKDFQDERANKVLICIVERDNEVYIPDGDFILREGDIIYVTGSKEELMRFYISVGEYNGKLKSTLIVGGSRIAYYLIDKLKELNIKVKVVENDYDRAYALSESFPGVEIVAGDGTQPELLEEERLQNYDSVVSLTGIDEENILISMFAKKEGVKKTITKVNRTSLLNIIGVTGLQTIVTPKQIVADRITRFVRAKMNKRGSKVDKLYRLAGNRVEAVEFVVSENSKVTGMTLKEMNTINNLLIAYIVRNREIIIPKGDTSLLPNDRVIVITTTRLEDLDHILA